MLRGGGIRRGRAGRRAMAGTPPDRGRIGNAFTAPVGS
ncbi:hypothetical protein [Azospirillum doebereinerae]